MVGMKQVALKGQGHQVSFLEQLFRAEFQE
jgi:hypothetical protein